MLELPGVGQNRAEVALVWVGAQVVLVGWSIDRCSGMAWTERAIEIYRPGHGSDSVQVEF